MYYLVIIVVCIITGFIIQPVDRTIKKNVRLKWLAVVLQFVAYFVIFFALYWIAALLGLIKQEE